MYIDVWFDQYTTSWVIQLKDTEENQIGKADYVHSKKEALSYANSHKEEYKEAIIRVYTRNGILQREIN